MVDHVEIDPSKLLANLMDIEKQIEKDLMELSGMLHSPIKTNNVEFFKELFEVADGMDITIHVKRKNDKITMSVLPGTVNKVQPVILTGTPEELEEGFFSAIAKPINDAKGLAVNTAAFDKSVEDAAKKGLDKSVEKNTGKKADEKPEKKTEIKSTPKLENSKPIPTAQPIF